MSNPDHPAKEGRDQWPSRDWKRLPDEGRMEREPSDPGPLAFSFTKDARAGSAEGVGGVAYEDGGGFDVTQTTDATLRRGAGASGDALDDGMSSSPTPESELEGAKPSPDEGD